MKRAGGEHLTAEDRILWSRVARTATPLPGKALLEMEEDAAALSALPPRETRTPDRQPRGQEKTAAGHIHHRPHRLDAQTREKLARGRLNIAGRVDLHGLTQSEAHTLLLSFLGRAFMTGRRYVLVITGKGSTGGEGVLRRAVPQWFAAPPFSAIVGAYGEAARHHGGAGALYVRLRRRRDGR